MGSFNSKAASKHCPITVHVSNQNDKTNEQRKEDGESFANIKTSDGDESDVSQNVEEEDPCMTKRRDSNTNTPKRPTNLHATSYLWLVSSPITQDEDNLMEPAVKCRSTASSIMMSIRPSRSDRLLSSKHESMKATSSRPQFYSYPSVSARTKTQSLDGENPSCTAGFVPFSSPRIVRRSKSTSKSNASAKILTRSVGFGVDKPYSYPVQRY